MFFKCKVRGGPFPFIIIEASDLDEAYSRALGNIPGLGDATLQPGDADPQEVITPLVEPWPIFTSKYFEAQRKN